jgi:hypothetical protein
VTQAGRFTRQHRKAGYVVKTLAPTLATDERLARAMLSRGRSGVDHYLSCLAAAGVRLPDELSVLDTGESGAAVRHRWADGGLLADSVTDDSHGARTFVEAVETIAGWVIRLDGMDARLDTNLANFCLHQDSVVALDVLPPLIPSLRPDPRDLYERLLFGLCFDSATTLAALVGYGAVRLLGHPDLEARRRFADDRTQGVGRAVPQLVVPRSCGAGIARGRRPGGRRVGQATLRRHVHAGLPATR